jgi:hypothetical protein
LTLVSKLLLAKPQYIYEIQSVGPQYQEYVALVSCLEQFLILIKNQKLLKKEIKDRKNPAWLTSYLLQTAWFLYFLYYIVWNLERFTLLTTLNYSDLRSIQEG